MVEQRYSLQVFPTLFILGFPQHCQNIQQAGQSCPHELLELFTQNKLGDTDSTGDAEEYERESETFIFASVLFWAVSHVVLVAYGQGMI